MAKHLRTILAAFTVVVITAAYVINATAQVQVWNGDLDGSTNANKIVSGAKGQQLPSSGSGALWWDGGAWSFNSSPISPGLAGQALFTNDAGITTAWAYPHGDVDASATDPGSLTVNAIQGFGVSTSVPSTGDALVYSSGLWRPSTVGTSSIAPGTAGTFLVTNGSSATAWSTLDTFDTTHGRITAGGGGTDTSAIVGPMAANETTLAALYLLAHGVSPTGSNYTIMGAGTGTYFGSGSGAAFFVDSSRLYLYNPSFVWDASSSAPSITQNAAGSDVATHDLTIEAQGPFATATGTNRNPGNFVVKTPTPVTGTTFDGGFLWERGDGTPGVRIGYYGGPDTTYTGIWFGDGGTPSSSNFAFLGNQSFTYLNAPSGQALVLAIAGSASTGLASTISGGNTWNMTGGSSLTAVNVGTGVSNGVMALRGGNGVTGVSVTAPGSTAGTATTTITGAEQLTTRTVTASFTVDTTTTDRIIFVDCTTSSVTVTLPTPTSGRFLTVIDQKNNCSASTGKEITLARHGTESIDSTAANVTIATSGSRTDIFSDGTNWFTHMGTKAN